MENSETNSCDGFAGAEKPAVLILDEQDDPGKALEDFFAENGYAPVRLEKRGDLDATPAGRLANLQLIVLSATFPGLETPRERCRLYGLFPMTPVILAGAPRANPEDKDSETTAIVFRVDRSPSPEALTRALAACRWFSTALDEFMQRNLFLRHSRYLEEPLARILHDLNNQITGLKGGCDLLNHTIAVLADTENQASLKRYMEQFIHPSLAQIEQLVQVWRHLRQSRLGPPIPADLSGVVRRGIQLAADPFQQGRIRIAVCGREMNADEIRSGDLEEGSEKAPSENTPDLKPAYANPDHLALAVAYAVQNALEAVEDLPDGRVLVTVDPAEEEMCRIEVHDNGPGIPEENRALIWRAFHSTKGRNRNGLGLAIARQVVEKYQGRIACLTSALGGACIRILVPAVSSSENGEN